jgi:hypothetical protein
VARRDDDESSEVEWLDPEPAPSSSVERVHGRRWRWWYALAAGVVVALAVSVWAEQGATRAAIRASRAPTTVATSPSLVAPSPERTSPAAQVTVTNIGHALLGGPADWELYGRGPGVVVRMQLALGRITRTVVPQLNSSGPVSFVVGGYGAIIRPLDSVPGYLVPDEQPARALPATLDKGGPAFPGPSPNDVWLPSSAAGGLDRMVLLGANGRSTRVSLAVPAGSSAQQAFSDANGFLLFTGLGGAYDVRLDGSHRITTGAVLAIGPTRWLVSECDDRGRCTTVVIERASGTRRTLAPRANDLEFQPTGVISPNGAIAAVIELTDQTATIHLRDLTSGVDHPIPVPIDESSINDGSLVWSPDSRWLFTVTARGHIAAVDAQSATVRDLGVPLPDLSQLAIRSASR